MEEFDTLVAFLDISGFKVMMKDKHKAYEAMREFYRQGFKILNHEGHPQIRGFFVSDCGILSVGEGIVVNQIGKLLNIIKILNLVMLEYDIMLTSSIAFGNFSFQQLTENFYIQKFPLYGQGYLNAYINAEVSEPKLKPGECRVAIDSMDINYSHKFEEFDLCKRMNFFIKDEKTTEKIEVEYIYYYWMVESESKIPNYQENYKDLYNIDNKEERYRKIKDFLIQTTQEFRKPMINNYIDDIKQ